MAALVSSAAAKVAAKSAAKTASKPVVKEPGVTQSGSPAGAVAPDVTEAPGTAPAETVKTGKVSTIGSPIAPVQPAAPAAQPDPQTLLMNYLQEYFAQQSAQQAAAAQAQAAMAQQPTPTQEFGAQVANWKMPSISAAAKAESPKTTQGNDTGWMTELFNQFPMFGSLMSRASTYSRPYTSSQQGFGQRGFSNNRMNQFGRRDDAFTPIQSSSPLSFT